MIKKDQLGLEIVIKMTDTRYMISELMFYLI